MTIVLASMMTASICHANEQVHHLLALLLGWYLLLESHREKEIEHIICPVFTIIHYSSLLKTTANDRYYTSMCVFFIDLMMCVKYQNL